MPHLYSFRESHSRMPDCSAAALAIAVSLFGRRVMPRNAATGQFVAENLSIKNYKILQFVLRY
jgi:hypothetical protein